MSIKTGYTNQEIRDLVLEHINTKHGEKSDWLKTHNLTPSQMIKWRSAVLTGDLERGKIPRKNPSAHDITHALTEENKMLKEQLNVLKAERDTERERHAVEVDAMGKAIGLLHETMKNSSRDKA